MLVRNTKTSWLLLPFTSLFLFSLVASSAAVAQENRDRPGRAGQQRMRDGERPGQAMGNRGGNGANEARLGMRTLMLLLDQDQDGSISKEELAQASQQLAQLDADENGSLERQEVVRGITRLTPNRNRRDQPETDRPANARGDRPNRPTTDVGDRSSGQDAETFATRMVERSDKNGDGVLSKDEVPERMATNFDRIDQSGDGSISEKELISMLQVMRRGANARGDETRDGADSVSDRGNMARREGMRERGGMARRGDAANMNSAQMTTQLIKRADKDEDGFISLEEAPENLKRGFTRIDSSGDGKLSKEEIEKSFQQLRRGRGGQTQESFDGVKPKRPGKKDDGGSIDAM